MPAGSGGFSVVITAQDQASKQIDALNKRIAALQAPAKRFNASLGRLAENTGVAQLSRGFTSMARSSLEAADSMARMAGPLSAITSVASIGGMAMLTAQWAQFGQQLGFSVQRAGTTVGQLGALQGAARLAGSSAEALTSGLTALNDNLTNAAAGRAPEAAMAFNYLQVSVRDATGRLRTATEVLPEVADHLAAIHNPAIQAQVATMLFGGAAEDLLPFLRRGSTGIAEYTTMAKRYGVVNDAGARAAAQLREQQVQLSLATQGLGFAIAEKLAPVVGPMLEKLANWIANNRDLIAQDLAHWVETTVPEVEKFAHTANDVAQALGGWKPVIEGILALTFAGWVTRQVTTLLPLVRLLALIPGSGVTAAGLAAVGISIGASELNKKLNERAVREGRPILGTDEGGNPIYGVFLPRAWENGGPHGGPFPAAPEAPRPMAPRGSGATPLPGPRALPPLSLPLPGGMGSSPPFGGRKPGGVGDPRGIRNNNPLNLSYMPGQIGVLGSDGRFGVYGSMSGGVAAAQQQLLRYQDVYGLNTVRGIISRWAPPSENDTDSYIAAVAARMGVRPDDPLNLHDQKTAEGLIAAMARRETGREIDKRAISEGVRVGLGGNGPVAPAQPAGISGPPVVDEVDRALRRLRPPGVPSELSGGPNAPALQIMQSAKPGGPAEEVRGGTGNGDFGSGGTTVRGSANVNIRLTGAPPGTRVNSSTEGDLFSHSGPVRVDLGQVGLGISP